MMRSKHYDPQGPCVMLGNPTSIFVRQFAAAWHAAGREVAVVAPRAHGVRALPDGTPVVDDEPFRSQRRKDAWERWWRRLAHWERAAVQPFARRFVRLMGRPAAEWEWKFVANTWNAGSLARTALALRPQFVLGQEATSFGLATALCRTVPRILVPWGGDVFVAAETSPIQYALMRYALRRADLVLPTSEAAVRHIHARFGVAPHKLQALSWGVDLEMFRPADPFHRARICADLGIDPRWLVVLHARRFHPNWGATAVLEACQQLASEQPNVHFIFLGGHGAGQYVAPAREQLVTAGLAQRFTLFDDDIPLPRCAELMAIADVFISLYGRGDMRSSSILQAAAGGGAPVLLKTPEAQAMCRRGFAAAFVDRNDPGALTAVLRTVCADAGLRRHLVARNAVYLRQYEDNRRQMDRMLDLIDAAGAHFCRAHGWRPNAAVTVRLPDGLRRDNLPWRKSA